LKHLSDDGDTKTRGMGAGTYRSFRRTGKIVMSDRTIVVCVSVVVKSQL